jgi:hypothetical protein
MSNRSITIHIERLILDDLPIASIGPYQRRVMQAAFEAELTQLIMNGELSFDLQTGGIRKQLPAGVLVLNADEPVETLGKKLAQAVYKGIGQ